MNDYNEQMDIAKKVMEEDKEVLSKMSDFKSVKQLCEENPNLNNHILSLTDIIAKLEVNNIDLTNNITKLEQEKADLVKRHIELENSLIELRKYHKEFEQFAATVYDPKKSTYRELEEKLKNFETSKNREIDELWATKIKPLREKLQQLEGQFISEEVKRKKDIDELWETRIIPLQNQAKDREIKMESMYKQQVSYTEEIRHLKGVVDRLNTIVNYAAGYISACKQFSDKHPNYVKDWLFSGISEIEGYKK